MMMMMMMMMMISWKEVAVPNFRTACTVAVILFMVRCAQLRRLCIKDMTTVTFSFPLPFPWCRC
jgi:hypothetical protein